MATLRNETSPVILVAIVLLGLIAGYFYYSQFLVDNYPQLSPVAIAKNDTLLQFKGTSFNFSVLDSNIFRALKTLGESPVNPGQTGRVDIFAPF